MDSDRGEAPDGRLRVSSTTTGERMIIPVAGEVDYGTSPQLSDELMFALSSGARCVQVDLSQVSFCDCSGLNALLSAREHAQKAGISFGVSGPVAPMVARLFALTGVEFLFLSLSECLGLRGRDHVLNDVCTTRDGRPTRSRGRPAGAYPR